MNKICSKCKILKDFSEFYNRSKSKDGKAVFCKSCRKEMDNLRYKYNPKKKLKNIEYEKKIRQIIIDAKTNRKCLFCDENEFVCLDFHHIDKTTKEVDVSQARSIREVTEEIKKCIVVCSNCHRKLHAGIIKYTGTVA